MITTRESDLRVELELRRERLEAIPQVEERSELRRLLERVDVALERLERGHFGLCEDCGGAVEEHRLSADPTLSVCLDCLDPGERRALEYDLGLAAKVQAALLPDPDLAALGWQVHYRYEPLGTVSGDHADLVRPGRTEDGLYFLLGDVSGKGVSASLLMSHLQALFRSLIGLGLPMAELVGQMNKLFCAATLSRSFATIVAGHLGRDGQVDVVNAGHPPPFVRRGGQVVPIHPSAPPLGVFCDTVFRSERLDLAPDELLFLYTDGISEAEDRQGCEYGTSRIEWVLERSGSPDARRAVGAVLEDLHAFRDGTPRTDDLTLMAIRRQAA